MYEDCHPSICPAFSATFFLYQYVWFFMLCKDENFVERVIKRYEELRDGWLEEDFLMNYIDETPNGNTLCSR